CWVVVVCLVLLWFCCLCGVCFFFLFVCFFFLSYLFFFVFFFNDTATTDCRLYCLSDYAPAGGDGG
ncbi:hypothetical protein, partial [Salmonella enterica]|uniref:hypothetical protein n=1 Tax=Salmonella enterica TaxID=28901 RepID=UPI0010EFFA3F